MICWWYCIFISWNFTVNFTINRKIDRKSLPIPNIQDIIKTEVNINSLSDTSQKLLQIWKDVLKVSDITVDDDFFDIGGDSISAIKMQIECVKYGINYNKWKIRKIDKTNLTYIEPHRIIIKDNLYLAFNYSNEIYIHNLGKKIKLSELENYIEHFNCYFHFFLFMLRFI